jgi:threonine dehydratase
VERGQCGSLDHAAASGAIYFHPFADPLVAAGQGTLGLEILEELPDMDAIVIAIGGGGLMAGVSTAIRARRPGVKIIGVEPVGSPTLKASIDAGHVVALPEVTSRVATMACRRTDERIFEIVRRNVDAIALVSDEDMAEASRCSGSRWGSRGLVRRRFARSASPGAACPPGRKAYLRAGRAAPGRRGRADLRDRQS